MLFRFKETGGPRSPRWSPEVLGKYLLLQLPSLALVIALLVVLRKYYDFPLLYTWAVVAAWVAKDVILYPFVWRAYDSRPQRAMVGLTGKAKEALDPSGYVEIRGELWRAQVEEESTAIRAGETVEVREVRGLTLIVRPVAAKASRGEI